MEPDITDKDVENANTILAHLMLISDMGISPRMETYCLKMLDAIIDIDSYIVHEARFPEIHRLIINKRILGSNKRIHDIGFLKYPPKDVVKSYGRCNKPNQSVLYASFGGLMIYSEMKPELGDLVTMSTWKTKRDDYLKFCPIFKNQPPNGSLNLNSQYFNQMYLEGISSFPTNIGKKVDVVTKFVADAFSKRFRRNSNDTNYLLSAYFSDIILNRYLDGDIDAILYPSVQQSLAFENLAIKPKSFDKKYELVSVDESIVTLVPNGNQTGYFSVGTHDCTEFDFQNDKILWGKSLLTEEEVKSYKKSGYDID